LTDRIRTSKSSEDMPVDRPLDGESPTAPEAHVGYLIGRVDRIVRRSLEAVLDRHALTLAQYTTLSVLSARPGLSSAQLARRSLVSPQGMNNIVNDLEGKGLIARTPHEDGGRVLRVAISPKGVEVLARCTDAVSRIEDTFLSGLTLEHRELFVGALQILARVPDPGTSRSD
jgi:DNA-binding MarR family transcriptional regulator